MKINTEVLTDYLNQQCDEQTKKEVENWINTDAKNKDYFEELKFYWDYESTGSKQADFDSEKGLNAIQSKRANKKQLRIRQLMRYAAVITLLIATSITSLIVMSPDFNNVVIENQALSEKVVKLPDGTEVLLAQGGTLKYSKSFNEKERLIDLFGEAYFDVTKDKSRPFIISTKSTQTKVLGTSFRIIEGNGHTDITVHSGIVEFMEKSNTSNKIKLVKGESAQFFLSNKVLLSKTGNSSRNQFKLKRLEYKNEKLESICKDLNKLFNANIKLENDHIKELSITTTFEDQTFENILQSISFSLDLDIEKKNDHILLK